MGAILPAQISCHKTPKSNSHVFLGIYERVFVYVVELKKTTERIGKNLRPWIQSRHTV